MAILLQELLGDMNAAQHRAGAGAHRPHSRGAGFHAQRSRRLCFPGAVHPARNESGQAGHDRGRIDELALMAFDQYMKCREQIAEARANEAGAACGYGRRFAASEGKGMKAVYSLGAVGAVVVAAALAGQVMGGNAWMSAVAYAGFAVFLAGFCYRVVQWAAAPVPFRIPTTCGQQKSLPWIKQRRVGQPLDHGRRAGPHGARSPALPLAVPQQPGAALSGAR